jgi:hypothetical protein
MGVVLKFKKPPYRSLEKLIQRAEGIGALGYGWQGSTYHINIEIAPNTWYKYSMEYTTTPDSTKQCQTFMKTCWLNAINAAETLVMNMIYQEGA